MVALPDGRCSPGIGDPTAMGWVTAAAYFGVALLCGGCAKSESLGGRQVFWLSVAAMMALLGINKQLDLQSWFTQMGRDLALAQGWYVHRQAVQAGFIVALTLGLITFLLWVQRATRALGGEIRWACLGLVLVALFVLVRAASFHHVDNLLHLELGGLRINWIMELGGIGCIGAAAVARLRRVAGS